MNRWKAYGKRDTQFAEDGDVGWQGIDMLHERSFLQPRMLARSENKRLWDGPAATRPGTTFPGDFNPVFTNTIIGSYIYSNPSSEEVMLVAEANSAFVWQLQFGKDPKKIQILTPDTTGAGRVEFVQAFDKVLMLRRPTVGSGMLEWDGDPLSTGTKFKPTVLSSTGLQLVPPGVWFGEPFENRVLYYYAYGLLGWRSQFLMSDILDYTSYDPVLQVFRMTAGQSDQIVRLASYYKGTIVAFMRNSIQMLQNFTVDTTQANQRVLSTKVGSAGNKMPLMVGTDMIFLSEPGGFYRLSDFNVDQIAADPIPISMPIQPIISRIDWNRKDSLGLDFVGCSAELGVYDFFAIPLDAKSGANDAIVVYNNATREWESAPDWWDDPNFRIDALHVTYYDQARRLFGLDYAAKNIYLLYDGFADNVNGNTRTIKDTIETRGYVAGDPGGFKRFERVLIGITTNRPQVTVTAISDGVGEELELASFTKDPTQSYVHGRGPTDIDPFAPKLEDYTTGAEFGDFAIQTFESLAVGDISVLPEVDDTSPGITAQQSLERFSVGQIGRWCSIRIENTSGECNIGGVAIEAIPIEESVKVIA